MSETIVPAKLPEGISRAMYNFVCQFIWGNVLIDTAFATESIMWKERAPIILERYPHLEKSWLLEWTRLKEESK